MRTAMAKTERGRKPRRYSLWTCFVLLVGYATLLYSLARGVIYLLTLMGGNA